MKRINAYETTDGQVFSDRKAAKEHQKGIEIMDALRHVAENAPSVGVDKDRLGDFLCDNTFAIEAALRGVKTSFVSAVPESEAAPASDDLNNLLGELHEAGDAHPVGEPVGELALAA